ncbi:MAG: hypothetical protein ACR2OH_02090, partial [Microthrixaceae bacterium]
ACSESLGVAELVEPVYRSAASTAGDLSARLSGSSGAVLSIGSGLRGGAHPSHPMDECPRVLNEHALGDDLGLPMATSWHALEESLTRPGPSVTVLRFEA